MRGPPMARLRGATLYVILYDKTGKVAKEDHSVIRGINNLRVFNRCARFDSLPLRQTLLAKRICRVELRLFSVVHHISRKIKYVRDYSAIQSLRLKRGRSIILTNPDVS
jgi:hypothetical protein